MAWRLQPCWQPLWLCPNIFKLSEETLYVMGYNVEWPTSESEQDLAYKVTSSADEHCWPGARGWQMISHPPALLHLSLFCKLDSLHLSRENPPLWGVLKAPAGSGLPSRICLFSSWSEAADDWRQIWHQLNCSNGPNNISCWGWYCAKNYHL